MIHLDHYQLNDLNPYFMRTERAEDVEIYNAVACVYHTEPRPDLESGLFFWHSF